MPLRCRFYCLIIFTIIFVSTTSAQTISWAQQKRDLEFLSDAIKNAHPTNEKDKLNCLHLIDSISAIIPDSINIREFHFQIKEIIAGLHCVHTSSRKSPGELRSENKNNYFPFSVAASNDTLYLIHYYNDSSITLSQPLSVTSINNISSERLIRFMRSYMTSDGDLETTGNSYIKDYGYYFIAEYLGFPDNFSVAFKTANGILQTLEVPAIHEAITKNDIVTSELNIIKMEDARFYNFLSDSLIQILDIDGFADHKYKKFYSGIFEFIAKTEINTLVIDLRDNLGGNRDNATELLGYFLPKEQYYQLIKESGAAKPYADKKILFLQFLKFNIGSFYRAKYDDGIATFTYRIKPAKNQFKGNVYVLVNGKSASASGYVAAYLQFYTDAIIIGEETAGGFYGNNGGSYTSVTLPESQIKIRFPVFRFKHDFAPENRSGGIIPSVIIDHDPIDIFNGTDDEMIYLKGRSGGKSH